MTNIIARIYVVRGRVQGVGYRSFAARHAQELNLAGYTKNLDNGDVEVFAQGPRGVVDEFAGYLHAGPRFADVRGVEVEEAALIKSRGFAIRY